MKKLLTIAALTTATTFAAQAEVRINGFANFVAGTMGSDETTTNLNGNLGYDDSLSFNEDSLFALQISADINDKMTATGQMVARGNNDYEAKFEWAYITYQATDELAVSLGRIRAPFFKYSSSTDIGYSYHWVTAPEAVYNVGFTNLNGFRVDYSNYAGDWEYNLQLAGGTYQSTLSGGDLSGKDTLVFTAEAAYDWFKVRGVVGRATASFSQDFFDGAFDSLGETISAELAEALRVNEDKGIFVGVGAEVDMYDWFVSAEMTSVDQTDSFAGEDVAFYVTGGMRFGSFTPSITYEELDGTGDGVRFTDIVAGLPAALQPTAGALNAAYQMAGWDEYSKVTATIRYDMDSNMALKADIAKFSDKLNDANDSTLLRFAVHYVF